MVNCPECNSEMVQGSKPERLVYRGYTRDTQLSGLQCPQCGESIHTAIELRALEDEWITFKELIDSGNLNNVSKNE